MYQKIYVPIDGSEHANACVQIALELAKRFGARVTGSHVYAARLHDLRFRQMENGLPERYQTDREIERQRKIHDALITQGLQAISESYLDALQARCEAAQVPLERKCLEGRNFEVLVEDIQACGYDLVVIGARGVGAVDGSMVGSVCERVVRRARTDVWVVRHTDPTPRGKIIVAIDGSPQAYRALKTALALGKMFGLQIEAVSTFDPFFHSIVFQHIAGVLSEKAGRIFRFREQERLHQEIINKGLAKIYQAHLDTAQKIAANERVKIQTALLSGKPYVCILDHVREKKPWLLVVGRIGIHSDGEMDIGSCTENLLRLAPCHLLISSQEFSPHASDERRTAADRAAVPTVEIPHYLCDLCGYVVKGRRPELCPSCDGDQGSFRLMGEEEIRRMTLSSSILLPWTEEARQRLEKVPEGFMRQLTKRRIEELARRKGYTAVTLSVVEEKYGYWGEASDGVRPDLLWTPEALDRVKNIPAFVRGMVIKEVEARVREKGHPEVTLEVLSEIKSKWHQGMPFHAPRTASKAEE